MYYFTDSDKEYWQNKDLQNKQLLQPLPQNVGGISPTGGSSLLTPELMSKLNAIRQEEAAAVSPLAGDRSQNNFIQNAGQDLADIVTGATHMITHPGESIVRPLVQEGFSLYDTYKDFGGGGQGLVQAISKLDNDAINFLIVNYGITTQDIYDAIKGDKKASEVVGTALKNAAEHPIFTALDILPVGAKLLKGTKGVAKTTEQIAKEASNLSPAQKVANALNISGAEVGGSANKFIDKSEVVKKGKYTEAQKKEAIKAHLTGEERPDLPKQLLKDVGESINSYDEMLTKSNKYAETLTNEDKFAIADAQRVNAREGNIRSFDEIKRERQPYYDQLKTDSKIVEDLAKEGDKIAQDILESKKQFDKGYLKIVPMAEITDINKVGKIDETGRVFAGRASDRRYGSATVDQIYETYFNSPNKWINNKVVRDIENTALGEIATKNTLGGAELVTNDTKKVKYINPESKSISSMVESASDIASDINKVAIDEKLLKELDSQFKNMAEGSNPFGNGTVLGDFFNIFKSNALVSGGYLAGNAQTALYNAIVNAGLNPLTLGRDFLEAWRSNSKLSKEVNTYRRLTKMGDRVKNPVLKGVSKWTGTSSVSDMLNYFDTKIQNTAAEMALHNNLREKGIPFEKRAEALMDMDKLSLAQVIDDVQNVALFNKTRTLLPASAGKVWAATNPFWRWSDTAIQSTYHMLKKRPMATNLIWSKAMGNLLFDQEMQDRANIGVQSDKPFVSYRYNPQTKSIQEVSAEFMPMMNTVKLFGETAIAAQKGDLGEAASKLGFGIIPGLTAIGNSFNGKDQYGRPILNARMDRRQMYANYGTGERMVMTPQGFKRVTGGTGEEVLGTTLNQFVGINRFANRTLMPAITGVANLLDNGDRVFYQPYQYQFVGEPGRAGQMPDYANPRRATSGMNSLDQLMGRYSRDYYPEYENYENRPIGVRDRIQMLRGMARRDARTNQILLNRGGGY